MINVNNTNYQYLNNDLKKIDNLNKRNVNLKKEDNNLDTMKKDRIEQIKEQIKNKEYKIDIESTTNSMIDYFI
jgi:anti-sigma28 factor (negative regulator of flagellin synthesis)